MHFISNFERKLKGRNPWQIRNFILIISLLVKHCHNHHVKASLRSQQRELILLTHGFATKTCNPAQFAYQLGLGPGFGWRSVQHTCLYSFCGQQFPKTHSEHSLLTERAAAQTCLQPLLSLFSTNISLAKTDYLSKPDTYIMRVYISSV